LKGNI